MSNNNRNSNKYNNNNLAKRRKNTELRIFHTKYRLDIIVTKIKCLILKNLLRFINEKIKEKYQSFVGNGILIKQLLPINYKKIDVGRDLFNIEYLTKSIGDIFSEDISSKYKLYPLSYNRNLIHSLKNEEDINKKNYFNKLFNLSFMDTIEHFIGSTVIEELKGMKTFDSIKQDFKDDDNYFKDLEYVIQNYDRILYNKIIIRKK